MREAEILQRVRLILQTLKVTTFRNNVGRLRSDDGRWVQFGLCEGSSDLIGWTEHVIQPHDVGRRVAIFTAIETKAARGRTTEAQETFLARVIVCGGIAGIARDEHQAVSIVERWKNGRGIK